ncbi:MAG: adenylate kinase [Rhodanobacter sp.]
MRLVLLGAPGSGKGTQATRLKAELGVPHISTGDMLRAAVAAGTPMGVQAKAVMASGQLVSDDILLGMLEDRLALPDVEPGFILDGYPRNLLQAAALDQLLVRIGQPLDAVLKLDVPKNVIVERCRTRFLAERRADDNPDTVSRRLAIYAEQTAPVADFYARAGKLQVVDGVGELNEVTERLRLALSTATGGWTRPRPVV